MWGGGALSKGWGWEEGNIDMKQCGIHKNVTTNMQLLLLIDRKIAENTFYFIKT
jgi:hypothetical protein